MCSEHSKVSAGGANERNIYRQLRLRRSGSYDFYSLFAANPFRILQIGT
jgi:hypothetical protein